MVSSRVKFTTPPEMKKWARGMKNARGETIAAAQVHWSAVTDVMFDRSQEYVHIISADLKSSGKSRVYPLAKSFVGEITYGGSQAPYAGYEFARGGEHDALGRAFESTNRLFGVAMQAIFTTAMERSKT